MSKKAPDAVMNVEIEMVPIVDVKPFEHNAKRHRKRDIDLLAEHIRQYGWDQPIVVVGETGEIIKGHKRREAALILGLSQVPVVKLFGLSETEIEERRLADNKLAESPWDAQVLKQRIQFLMAKGSSLQAIGFSDLAKQIRNTPTKPEVVFSEILGESNNYIVLRFDNDIDWLSAQTHFRLDTVASRRANGKPWSMGIGRVVDGGAYLRKLKGGEGGNHGE